MDAKKNHETVPFTTARRYEVIDGRKDDSIGVTLVKLRTTSGTTPRPDLNFAVVEVAVNTMKATGKTGNRKTVFVRVVSKNTADKIAAAMNLAEQHSLNNRID